MEKICSCCKIAKDIVDFNKNKSMKDGLSPQCKYCTKLGYEKYKEKRLKNKADYYQKNKDKKIKWQRKYYRDNKEARTEYNKQYNSLNKERIGITKKEYIERNYELIQKKWAEYYQNNKDKRRAYEKNKRKVDPLFKLSSNIRRRLNSFIKNKKKKSNSFIGCSYEFLKTYLEKKFTSEMSWDNYGSYWHIDHVIPLASAQTEEELYKLCHYTNLQPLEAKENIRKGSKILGEKYGK